MVAKWRDQTPEGFAFSLKVPQTIMHEKCLAGCEQNRDSFLAAARLLGNKLLCCLRSTASACQGRLRRAPGIALCLSGGGFRAALFHLGALRISQKK
jgi:hypothetical protein